VLTGLPLLCHQPKQEPVARARLLPAMTRRETEFFRFALHTPA
jgi:hypothetical protein